jgi:REP element-mobilizing transposase RayT
MGRRPTPISKNLHPSAHGGTLRNSRKGRGARRVSTRYSMHIVLRSSQARGALSFLRPQIRRMIGRVLSKHAARAQAKILTLGNAGNHLHLRIQFGSRRTYMYFIRAVTGEIALHIKRLAETTKNFWDRRPFSCIVSGARYVTRLTDYIRINSLEGQGYPRAFARLVVETWRRQGSLRAAPS